MIRGAPQPPSGFWTSRVLRRPPERVWQAITNLDELGRWFPELAGRLGGAVGATGMSSSGTGAIWTPDRQAITEYVPHRVFEVAYQNGVIRFELAPRGTGTRLRIAHFREALDVEASTATATRVCSFLRSAGGRVADTVAEGFETFAVPDMLYAQSGLPTFTTSADAVTLFRDLLTHTPYQGTKIEFSNVTVSGDLVRVERVDHILMSGSVAAPIPTVGLLRMGQSGLIESWQDSYDPDDLISLGLDFSGAPPT